MGATPVNTEVQGQYITRVDNRRKVIVFGYRVWPWLPLGFKLSHTRYYMTVEPLGLLLYLGLYTLLTVQPQLQDMRFTLTYQDDVYKDTPLTSSDGFDNAMQGYIILWNQLRLAANIPVAVFMGIFLGSWSDRHGRQFNILMGIVAMMVGYCFAQSMLYSYTVLAPLWTWVLMTFIEACFGNNQLSYFAGQAYQADLCPDKDELTIRMNIVSVMRAVGAAIGSAIAANVSVHIGLVMSTALGNTIIFISYVYIFFWVVQIPPKAIDRARNEWAVKMAGDAARVVSVLDAERRQTRAASAMQTVDKSGTILNAENPDEEEEVPFSVMREIRQMGADFKAAWHTFTRPRKGYKRGCIWALSAVGFVSTLGGQEAGVLLGTYLHFVAKWDSQQLGDWQVENIVVGLVGQFVGIFVLKRVFKLRDTWILNIALFTFGLSNIPIAWPNEITMRISNYIQLLAALISPTLSSLITSYVEPEEVGRVILAVAITLLLAIVGQTWGLQFLYLNSLKWFPGFMFILVAFLNIICCVLVLWVDYVEKPVPKTYNVEEILDEELEEIQQNATDRRNSTRNADRSATFLDVPVN